MSSFLSTFLFFLEVISRLTFQSSSKSFSFPPSFFCFSFSSLRAVICSFPSPGWSPSSDLGGSETLLQWWDLSADTAGEVAGDITPLALACIGNVFFQSLQIVEWRFYQGSAFCLTNCSGLVLAKQSNYFLGSQWNGYLRQLFIFGRHKSSDLETTLCNSFTQFVSKCMSGMDLGSNLTQLHHLNHWLGRLVCTCHSD